MPIEPYKPPKAMLRALEEATPTLPAEYSFVGQMIGDVMKTPDKYWCHPVYTAGLRDMTAAGGLKKADLAGWRFLVQSGKGRKFALDVRPDEDGKNHALTEIDKGPYIDALCKLLDDKTLVRQLGATVYKPSTIRINALGVFAVWLRTEKPGGDIIIPCAPAPRCLKVGQHYTVAAFEEALRAEAKKQLKSSDRDA
ncbi:MAG: hypothetical protein ACKV2V_22850 [Blastocatellia bacterium]